MSWVPAHQVRGDRGSKLRFRDADNPKFRQPVGSLRSGTIGSVTIADAFITGETAEDRFFGVQDPQGIIAIKLSNTFGGIEIDHIQYGEPPVPQVPLWPGYGGAVLGLLLLSTAVAARRNAARVSARG